MAFALNLPPLAPPSDLSQHPWRGGRGRRDQ